MKTKPLLFISIFTAALLNACDSDNNPPPALGTLERYRLELVAEAREPVIELAVKKGQRVNAGQLLVRLDPQRHDAELNRALARENEASQRLLELQSGPRSESIQRTRSQLSGAQARRINARKEFTRVQEIVERGLQSQAALDQARSALDTALAEENALRAQLDELLAGTRGEQLAQAEAARHAIQAEVETLRIQRDRLTLRAPVDGIIDALPYRVGERPPPGATVVVLLEQERLFARVYLPQQIRANIKPGDAASINISGRGNQYNSPDSDTNSGPYPGIVRWIAADAAFTPFFALNQKDRDRLSYLAEIDLDKKYAASDELATGLPVQVSFPRLTNTSGRGND